MKPLAASGALAALLLGCAGSGDAQAPPVDAPMPAHVPSTLLRPALSLAGRDLDTVHAERWKLNSIVRDQTASDLKSVQRDLDTTLPPLLIVADQSPTVVAMLPVSRNVNALYNVLVRLVERGRAAAPQEQESALEQARQSVDAARRAFDENLQATAGAEEKLRAELANEVLHPLPPPPPPPVPAAPAKKRARPKPVAPAPPAGG